MGMKSRLDKLLGVLAGPPPGGRALYLERLYLIEARIHARPIVQLADLIGPGPYAEIQAYAHAAGIPYVSGPPDIGRQLLIGQGLGEQRHNESMYVRWMCYVGGAVELQAKDKRWREGVIGEWLDRAGIERGPEVEHAVSGLTTIWHECNYADWSFGDMPQAYYTWSQAIRKFFLRQEPSSGPDIDLLYLLGEIGWPQLSPNEDEEQELRTLYGFNT